MAIRKVAIVCAVFAVLALVSASTLDLDMNFSEEELSLSTEASMLELDNALQTVRAMDQDLSLIETESVAEAEAGRHRHRRRHRRHGGAAGAVRKIGNAVSKAAKKAGRFLKKTFGRKGKKRLSKRQKRKLARKRALRKKHKQSKAYQKRKLAKKLEALAAKTGNAELMQKAREAAKAANHESQKAAAKKVKKQAKKAKAAKKAKKALKKKAKKAKKALKKAKKALKKKTKKAKKALKKAAKKRSKKSKKTTSKASRAAANKALANQIAGDTHMPKELQTIHDTITRLGAELAPTVTSAEGKEALEKFTTEVGRVTKLMAHVRNIHHNAKEKLLKARRKGDRAKRHKRKVAKTHTPTNPAEKHRLEAAAEQAAKDEADAAKADLDAQNARADAVTRAKEEEARIAEAKKLRKEAADKLEKSLSPEGKLKYNTMLGKIIESEKLAESLITNAKAIPLAVPDMTREEVVKADPKGTFKALAPDGVTAAQARRRIIKMHEENKFHDFSTMAMDKKLGVTAEIPPKFTA